MHIYMAARASETGAALRATDTDRPMVCVALRGKVGRNRFHDRERVAIPPSEAWVYDDWEPEQPIEDVIVKIATLEPEAVTPAQAQARDFFAPLLRKRHDGLQKGS